ncbi:PaaI family thioesterase [Dyadobacter subterraneus]|uniref:PaaI family thioesterase n=1 Tax=Dyadobacter subterraneus TaxID=2773304 RepID=A0ABR9WII5_9BACT|nr:PaaI family thioesterase [Dyadobacter subterraneus]MBE9465250.1 PaaI family thioesterase [Dyadobacter subterraneus]
MNESLKPDQIDDKLRLKYMQTFIGKRMEESHSPVGRWLNGTLLDIQEGSMKVEFVVRKDMSNPMGILHGGIAATILDEVVGTMVYALGREFAFVSVNLNCDFLNAARVGETIFASGNVIRAGKNIVHVEGNIVSAEGVIIAKCTSNLLQTGLKIPPIS